MIAYINQIQMSPRLNSDLIPQFYRGCKTVHNLDRMRLETCLNRELANLMYRN